MSNSPPQVPTPSAEAAYYAAANKAEAAAYTFATVNAYAKEAAAEAAKAKAKAAKAEATYKAAA